MKVVFHGVRGSLPTPGPGTVRYGGNTPCVEVVIPESDQAFVIDAGTGIRELGLKLIRQKPRAINLFISHTHWDHIQGFPFFTPIFIPSYVVNVFGPTHDQVELSLHDVLTNQMHYSVFPVRYAELQASLTFTAMGRQETKIFGDVEVTAHPLNHPVLTLGYRITHAGRTVVYQSDHEPWTNLFADDSDDMVNQTVAQYNQMIVDFARDADLLIADSMYTDKEYETHRQWGHSSVGHVLERARASNVKRLALFHHDPIHNDEIMDSIVAEAVERARGMGSFEVFAAKEGMEVDLG